MASSPLERLLRKITVLENGCWEFTGALDKGGYGHISDGTGYPELAHRLSFAVHKGEIPAGTVIDHICHDPAICAGGKLCPHRRCVNPDHLELATQKINKSTDRSRVNLKGQRAASAKKRAMTHCHKGHEFTPDNTHMDSFGRHCKECQKERGRTRRRRLREANMVPKKIITHCLNGHEYTPENTYTQKRRNGVLRSCKECRRNRYLGMGRH